MRAQADSDAGAGSSYVSTGHLPDADLVTALVAEAHARYRSNSEGANSQVYPALAAVPSELFGVCVVGTSGTTNNLAAAVGTAVAGALVLSASVMRYVVENPIIPPALKTQVDLDNINFVSNDRLLEIMQRTTATPQQVTEAMRINEDARLRALKIGLLIMAGAALLALIPAGRLPPYRPGELPAGPPETRRKGRSGSAPGRQVAAATCVSLSRPSSAGSLTRNQAT
jgi:hypothetical protein